MFRPRNHGGSPKEKNAPTSCTVGAEPTAEGRRRRADPGIYTAVAAARRRLRARRLARSFNIMIAARRLSSSAMILKLLRRPDPAKDVYACSLSLRSLNGKSGQVEVSSRSLELSGKDVEQLRAILRPSMR